MSSDRRAFIPFPSAGERLRILASHAFRRLAGKTQVITCPAHDDVSTRLTHTLEVTRFARAIAAGLSCHGAALDDDLIEAIALAHDVGHPPFGHAGEAVLARLAVGSGLAGFHHAAFGVRLLSTLERSEDGRPIVRSPAVIEGVLTHSKGKSGAVFAGALALQKRSTEALIVRAADLYAYASFDLEDAYRLGVLTPAEVPERAASVLGRRGADVRRALVARTVAATLTEPHRGLHLDAEADDALATLRAFLYERFYEGPATVDQTRRAADVLTTLWRLFEHDLTRTLCEVGWTRRGFAEPSMRDALDATACMTDRFAIELAARHARPPRILAANRSTGDIAG